MAAVTMKVTENMDIVVALSKFKAPQIEIRRNKSGQMKKSFLTTSQCKAIYEAAGQVTPIMLEYEKSGRKSCHKAVTPPTVEIKLDEKKLLTITSFMQKSRVQIDVLKDGNKQPGLAFPFDLGEWKQFLAVKDKVNDAVRQLRAKLEERNSMDNIPQYNWLCVKLDGTGIDNYGQLWNYVESEAVAEAQRACEDNCRPHIQQRQVERPELSLVYNAAHAYLVRQALAVRRAATCEGCNVKDGDILPGQEAHMQYGGCLSEWQPFAEALYPDLKGEVSILDAAGLYHQMAAHLGIVTPSGSLSSALCDETVRAMAVAEEHPEPELDALCGFIHRRQIAELSPFRE